MGQIDTEKAAVAKFRIQRLSWAVGVTDLTAVTVHRLQGVQCGVEVLHLECTERLLKATPPAWETVAPPWLFCFKETQNRRAFPGSDSASCGCGQVELSEPLRVLSSRSRIADENSPSLMIVSTGPS
jgi:hypothetical protein